jgi:hypothetical protein
LRESPESTWEPGALGLAADAAPANTPVASLHARGLVTAVPTEAEIGYRYGLAAPELAATAERVLDLCRMQPVTVIRLISDPMKKSSIGSPAARRG